MTVVSPGGFSIMDLPPHAPHDLINVVVDTPRGSTQKYKFDTGHRCFRLSRILPAGMHFPFDFGAIPGTKAADGDALDVVLLSEQASFVGCLVTALLVGSIEATQREGGACVRNDRLLAVPVSPVNPPRWREIDEVPAALITELEQFFVGYNRLQGRVFEPLARRGPDIARWRVLEAHKAARRDD